MNLKQAPNGTPVAETQALGSVGTPGYNRHHSGAATNRVEYSASKNPMNPAPRIDTRQTSSNSEGKNLKLNSQRYGTNIMKVQPGHSGYMPSPSAR